MLRRTVLLTVCAAAGFAQERQLAHNVYFTLKDKSPGAAAGIMAACRKYLKGHPGEVSFDVGTLAVEFNREVNDRDFQVSLRIVFRSKADHDRYQAAPRHKQFVAENEARWDKVRVFDTYLSK